jgi:D-alanyl-D-alanine carboxypeptidase
VGEGQVLATGAALFCVDDLEPLYAKNVYTQLHPASLTKIMTALVALKYGTIENYVTVSSKVNVIEAGAQVCGLKEGDQLTLAQALHLSLINSANDAAIVVAEGVAGTVDEFVLLMNREARALGATNTNFVNPHGLTAEGQTTTVYDMYLILNEAIKYEVFNQIIKLDTYAVTYRTAGGGVQDLSVTSSNGYLRGDYNHPANITILGGKTGTTNAAGYCLATVARDERTGKTYIAIVMQAESRQEVYRQTNELLREIE